MNLWMRFYDHCRNDGWKYAACLLIGIAPLSVLAEQNSSSSKKKTPVEKSQKIEINEEQKPTRPRPGVLREDEIEGFAQLSDTKKVLIREALRISNLGLSYEYASADPKRGGMDCSGAIYYVLTRGGLKPPRSSDLQYRWVWEGHGVRSVEGSTFQSFEFSKLAPGDLLFWSGTYQPKSVKARDPNITHVMLYLGKLKKNKTPVMFGASEGRVYEGTSREGVGVFEFKLPRVLDESSGNVQARFVGYGAIPDLEKYQLKDEPVILQNDATKQASKSR